MALALVLIFIVVPIAELYVLIEIGSAIGILPTIALLILDCVLGAALMRSQGRAAWMRVHRAVEEEHVPGREVIDGVLVTFGGALLLTPGFISDFLGLIVLLAPASAIVRTALVRRFAGGILPSAGSGAQSRVGRISTFETGHPPLAFDDDVVGVVGRAGEVPPRRRELA